MVRCILCHVKQAVFVKTLSLIDEISFSYVAIRLLKVNNYAVVAQADAFEKFF